MARVSRISIALCALLFTTLPLTPMVHASKQTRESFAITRIIKKTNGEKSTATTKKIQKTAEKAVSKSMTRSKTISSVKESFITASRSAKTRSKHVVNKTASASFTEECVERKGCKSHCVKVKNAAPGTLADVYKAKVQKAAKVAMNKLVQQVGRPYRWGGSLPRTGFDCSGLVYYVYKDLAKIRTPRTAGEIYHPHDTALIERSELENGDLVLFRTQGHGTVDHVGVYADNGRFIQPSRIGQEIRIISLSKDY